jgi:hypothetical protein
MPSTQLQRYEFVRRRSFTLLSKFVLSICVCILSVSPALAAPVTVHYREGLMHGFLVMSTLDGAEVADGDLLQVPHGNQITSRLIFHFKDGSLWDETVVFSQRTAFRLLTYHLVQKGPSFQHDTEVSIKASTGEVAIRYNDDDGKEKVINDRMKLPPDLANGMVLVLLRNLPPTATPAEVSMLAITPKPRLIKLAISSQGEDSFSLGALSHKAFHYVVKVQIGGVAGLIAPLFGKQPPDTNIWVMGGEAPTFVKSEGLLSFGAPIWRIELIAPGWPKEVPGEAKEKSEEKH